MARRGWHNESGRHSLAARGIETHCPKPRHAYPSKSAKKQSLTNDDMEVIWDALYGRRSQAMYANDQEARDKYNRVLEKVDALLDEPHYATAQSAKKKQFSENAIRDMFLSRQYNGKIPDDDIQVMLKSPQWHKLYGKKELKEAWEGLVKENYAHREGNNWIWELQ